MKEEKEVEGGRGRGEDEAGVMPRAPSTLAFKVFNQSGRV
jgi:hypothetical protein